MTTRSTERLTDCTCGTPLHSTTGTSTTLSKYTRQRACVTGVSNLSKNCTCGKSTGTPSNCGTSVVCTVTTRHQSLNNNGCHQLVQQLYLRELDGLLNSRTVGTMPPKDSREVQHIVDELNDDRKRRGQGRRSIFPNRLSTARLRLPRQPATANGATTPGFSGPFPSHSGVFGLPPLFVCCSPRWFESTFFCSS